MPVLCVPTLGGHGDRARGTEACLGESAPLARLSYVARRPAADMPARDAVAINYNEQMSEPVSKRSRRLLWRRLFADRRGATTIEYGLMVALIGLTVMGTISSAGQAIKNTLYGQIVNALSSVTK
jgi:pilus assembly protein Flp/PilA